MSRFTRLCWRVFAAFLVVATFATSSAAQGVTTAALTGVVKDAQGAVVPGATIVAVHQPSGTTYTGSARATDGTPSPACAWAGPTRSLPNSAGLPPKNAMTSR